MRTGAIFARGSCRALKWTALPAMVLALMVASSGTALAQVAQTLTDVYVTIEGPRTVGEGDEATFTVTANGTISARDARTTANGGSNLTTAGRTITVLVDVATVAEVAATTGEIGATGQPDDGAIVSNPTVSLVLAGNTGSGARTRSATADITFRTNDDTDAEDEILALRVETITTTGAASTTEATNDTAQFTIEDDETQTYELTLDTVTHTGTNPPQENDDISVNLKAVPEHYNDGATLTLYVDNEDGEPARGYAALGATSTAGTSTAAIGTVDPTSTTNPPTPLGTAVNTRAITISQTHNADNGDGNRVTDTITLRAYTGVGEERESGSNPAHRCTRRARPSRRRRHHGRGEERGRRRGHGDRGRWRPGLPDGHRGPRARDLHYG